MFARVAVYEVPGERMDEAVESFRGAVSRIREKHPEEVWILVSPEGDRVLSMSLWERQADMDSSGVMASGLRAAAADAVGGSVQSVVEYEVAIRQRNGS